MQVLSITRIYQVHIIHFEEDKNDLAKITHNYSTWKFVTQWTISQVVGGTYCSNNNARDICEVNHS